MKQLRQSNFELLRILSIMLIIFHHFSLYYNSTFNFNNEITMNRLIIQFFSIGGKIGVIIFILISGYFMINQKFKITKFIKIILQILTYCTFGIIFHMLFNDKTLNILQFMQLLFLNFFNNYWFILPYLIVYLLSPFINIAFNSFTQKDLKKLIIILIILQSIIPNFLFIKFEFSNVLFFITLYIIGAYINKYPINIKNNLIPLIIFLITYLLTFFTIIGISILKKYFVIIFDEYYFIGLNSIFTIVASISLFLFFKNIEMPYNKFINILASTTLGIYLFHENSYIKDSIWNTLNTIYNISPVTHLLFFKVIAIGITVYIVGCIIELIRKFSIEIVTNTLLKKLFPKKQEQ